MWTMVVAVAIAGKNKPPKAPKAAAAAGPAAVARYVDGRIELARYDAPVGCDAQPETEPTLRAVLTTTEDTHGWLLSELQVGGATHGLWYADGERKVAGLDALVTGPGTLTFDPVTLALDEGGEATIGSIPATWCGAPLGSVLAHPTDEGVLFSVFPAGSLHACPDGQYGAGDVTVTVAPWVEWDAHGWGVRSVMDVAEGAVDDFTFGGDGPKARPVTLAVEGSWLTASFAPLPPTPVLDPSSRTRTVTGPLKAVWCGESPLSTEVGAAAPGGAGGWMRVGTRWFEVQGARWSKKEGLELSTLPLSCDTSENYMEDAVHMNLDGSPASVDFWSVSGNWHLVPASWNRGDRPPFPMPKAEGDTLVLSGSIDDNGWTMELKGSVPFVRCD